MYNMYSQNINMKNGATLIVLSTMCPCKYKILPEAYGNSMLPHCLYFPT